MAPKKTNKKNKSKRYSCELCTGINNALMAECDNCEAKYHFKCLNVKSIDTDDGWICSECRKRSAPSNKSMQQPSKPDNLSKHQENISKSVLSQVKTGRQNSIGNGLNDDRNTERQSQDGASVRTSQRSKKTGSSLGRKAQLELDRLEEERQLKERRDKEYLDSKYRILMEECSEKASRAGSERRSTDRSSFTKDWVQKQSASRIPENTSQIRADKSQIPPTVQRTDSSINRERYRSRIDELTFDGTYLDRKKQTIDLADRLNRELNEHLNQLRANGSTEPNATSKPSECQRSQLTSNPFNTNHMSTQVTFNRERIPCPKHDASQFMIQGHGKVNLDQHTKGIPCSNSTFALPPKLNGHATDNRGRDQRSYATANEQSLEWDNFVGMQDKWEKDPKFPPTLQQVQSSTIARMQRNLEKYSNLQSKQAQAKSSAFLNKVDELMSANPSKQAQAKSSVFSNKVDELMSANPSKQAQAKSSVFSNKVDELMSANPSKQDFGSFFMDLHSKSRARDKNQEKIEISDDDPFQSEPEENQSNFKERNYDDDTMYEQKGESFKSNCRSTNEQSQRKVQFDHSEDRNPYRSSRSSVKGTDRSNNLSVQSQQNVSYDPIVPTSGGLTPSQIAARHVVDKKLPTFVGDPKEWQIWYHQYKNSTKLCGFSNGENLDRLQKCIWGNASDVIKGRLLHPDSVPWIIETLEMLYGRPEVIIKAIIDDIRQSQPLKSDSLEDLMDFAFEVQTICTTIESLDCVNRLPDPMLIEALVSKLPIQEKKDWAKYKIGISNVNLKTLSDWLYNMAKVLSTVASPRTIKSKERKPEKEKFDRNEKTVGLERVNVHVNQTTNESATQQRKQNENVKYKRFPCLVCKNECNKVEDCSKFKSFSIDARWKVVNEHKICRRCLRKHKDSCRATTVCGKNGCQYKHHSMLHNNEKHSPPRNDTTPNTTLATNHLHTVISVSTMLRIVPVILYNGSKSIATFAFLDDGTTVTMMENWLAKELGLHGTSEQICLIWTKKIHRRERAERVSLQISGIGEFNRRYEMKGVRTVDELHLPAQTINKNDLVEKYPYLKDVPFADFKNAIPGIMIGSDLPKLGTQLQVIESPEVENVNFRSVGVAVQLFDLFENSSSRNLENANGLG